jgi:uncharacterized damage-inducible protein DinB
MRSLASSILTGMLLLAIPALCQTQSSPSFMVAEWQRAKIYTREYLDAMPDDGYSFKPTPEVRTFAQQFIHLGVDNFGFAKSGSGKADPYADAKPEEDPAMQSKAAVTKFVMDSYDFAIDALMSLTPAQLQEKVGRRMLTREQIFFKGFEHQTHHRGQTTVYLRLKGVKPPNEKLFD